MFDRIRQLLGPQPQQQDYEDFVQRYQHDPGSISDAEAAHRYREMMAYTHDDDDQDYDDDVVYGQMLPGDRRTLAQYYKQATNDPSYSFQGYPQGMNVEQAAQPRNLGRMTRRAAREDGDFLEQLVGPNSPLSGTAGKLALAGGAAFLARRFFERR